MPAAEVTVEGVDRVVAGLGRTAQRVAQVVQTSVQREGLTLQGDVKRNAGRPRTAPSVPGLGPRIQTGVYNGSIGLRFEGSGASMSAVVETAAVQAFRLEYGFQAPGAYTAPHPHFRPAIEVSAQRFPVMLERAIGSVL